MSSENSPNFTAHALIFGAAIGLGASYAGGVSLSYVLMRGGAIFVMLSCVLLILFSVRLKRCINNIPNNVAEKIGLLLLRLWIFLIALAGGVGVGALFFYWIKLKGII